MFRPGQPEAEEDRADAGVFCQSGNLGEVEIKGNHDALISRGAAEYFIIRRIAQTELSNVKRVVTCRTQPLRHGWRKVHVQQQAHL